MLGEGGKRGGGTGEGEVLLGLGCMLRRVWALKRIGVSKRALGLLLGRILRLVSGRTVLRIS
jgi:hypothetical protein